MVMAGTVLAQQAPERAWQRRLSVQVPLPLPVMTVEPVDPLAVPVDTPPRLLTVVPPRKVSVSGTARVAAYVTAEGSCEGAVPVTAPFPGVATELVADVMSGRFEPARSGKVPRPSWSALDITLAGKVRRAAIVDQSLQMPDAAVPPEPAPEPAPYVSGRLAGLPAADPGELTSVASPRRLTVRIPSREVEVPLRLLVHLTAGGTCDGVVPLEMAPGLRRWVLEFLGSWRVEPALQDGQPVDVWAVYRGRVRLKLSGLGSTTVRVVPGAAFIPVSGPSARNPPAR